MASIQMSPPNEIKDFIGFANSFAIIQKLCFCLTHQATLDLVAGQANDKRRKSPAKSGGALGAFSSPYFATPPAKSGDQVKLDSFTGLAKLGFA